MNYLWAFVIGGGICAAGQILIDLTGLTPARILTGYVVAGVVLSALGWYAPLAELAGCGATVPLLGFGHLLAKGVRTALQEEGGHRHPHRRAHRRCRRHHHQPRLRRGLLLGRPEPRPELARNKKRRCFAPVRARRVVGCKKTKTPAPETGTEVLFVSRSLDQA